VAQFPNDSEALHNLALLHYWQRDYQAAGRIFQRLLEKAADDAALRLEAAGNAEAGQQLDQALATTSGFTARAGARRSMPWP
jgi:Flp pilus assembly protein TadD